jgi:hypothetical protein
MSLTTRAKVREHLQIPDDGDASTDDLIDALVVAVSEHVTRYCDREFMSQGGTPITRTFLHYGSGLLNLAPYDAREVSTVKLRGVELAADDWEAWPIPQRDGVISHLLVPDTGRRETVEVTGLWGWPAVPSPVERAVTVGVAYMLRTSSQWMSNEYDVDAGMNGARVVLPGAARALLGPYKRRAIGH